MSPSTAKSGDRKARPKYFTNYTLVMEMRGLELCLLIGSRDGLVF